MPGIRLFGRRFNFASDDLAIPSLIDIGLRCPSVIAFIIFRIKDESPDSHCPSAFYNGYFYPLLSVYGAITILASIMFYISLRGSPVKNTRPRRHMPLFIYLRLILLLFDIIINILGLIIIIRVYHSCATILRATIVITIALSWSVAISLFIILAFFIDLTGVVSPEKKWEMRIKFVFCCGRGYGGQSSDIKNIVKTLQYLFDDDRFDLVPSDVAAGLILLQREDVLGERSIDIIQPPPLELLKQGLYYNSYAQSAFGWFSLAYQYRFTFLPRILFAMNFRTIGFCCGCCNCCAPCCGNEDSLNDPCASQYSTLRYLLRKQKPVILYANFLGAFHRAPFYIAADNEKKTIVVSIRGTLSATDILTDINAVEDVLETELFGKGYCHSGMHLAANYIRDDISERLQHIFERYPDHTLVICGYSLGAGIASILAIQFKSTYPHLKCYGIAMPGAVLSENLVLATRDFIYSYVVDVDMIGRASIRSLEHLRNRIIDTLDKCDKNKLRILTMTLVHTLTKRRQAFHSMNSQTQTLIPRETEIDVDPVISQIVLTDDHADQRVPLIMPGTIVHLYSINRIGLFSRRISYRACMSTYKQFSQLIVHPRMWLDHFPASYSTALTDAIENYDQILQQIA